MPINDTLWHYKRDKEAERYIDLFNSGITNGSVLFGKVGYGKTSFLQRDIKPLAIQHGYDVIYCSSLSDRDNPTLAILQSIKEELGFSLNNRLEDSKAQITELSSAFSTIADRKRASLFLFDDISYLSTKSSFAPLTACIRTALDQYSHKLYAICTGSSKEELSDLFNNISSPFYNFAQQYELQDMDISFLNFVCEKLNAELPDTINIEYIESIWHKLDKSPYHFMEVIKTIHNKNMGIEKAYTQYTSI